MKNFRFMYDWSTPTPADQLKQLERELTSTKNKVKNIKARIAEHKQKHSL